MATVFIPSLMRALAGGLHRVEVEGSTVRQIVEGLEKAHPGIRARLVENDKIKSNISVAIDGEVTPLGMLGKVGETSEVHFLPAIGGGSGSVYALGWVTSWWVTSRGGEATSSKESTP